MTSGSRAGKLALGHLGSKNISNCKTYIMDIMMSTSCRNYRISTKYIVAHPVIANSEKAAILNLCFYFQDWLDDQAERAHGSFNKRTITILIGTADQVHSFFVFYFYWGLIITKLYDFLCHELLVIKSSLTPQNDRKTWFDKTWQDFSDMYTPQTTGSAYKIHFLFFGAL